MWTSALGTDQGVGAEPSQKVSCHDLAALSGAFPYSRVLGSDHLGSHSPQPPGLVLPFC